MRIIIPVLVLLASLILPAAGQVTVTPDFNQAKEGPALRASVEAMYPRTLALLKREFPEAYATLAARIDEIDESRDEGRAPMLAVFEEIASVRRSFAERISFAPTVSHSVMLGIVADFFDTVLKQEGASVCGRFAHDGSAVLVELGLAEKYATQLDMQSLAFFDAVVKAVEAPEEGEAVKPEDWTAVMAAMVRAGAPSSFLSTIAAGRAGDPDLCPALSAMFRTSGLLDTPEGKRTRADFAKNLTGY